MKLRAFLYSQALVNSATLVSTLCYIIFYAIALRFTPAQFSEVAAVMALNFATTVASGTMGTYVLMRTKEGISLKQAGEEGMRIGLSCGLLLFFAFLAGGGWLRDFFHFTSVLPFVVMGAACLPSIGSNVVQSVQMAQKRFLGVALSALFNGAGLLLSAFVFFHNGYDSTDAPFCILVANLLSLLVILLMDGDIITPRCLLPLIPGRTLLLPLLGLLWSLFVVSMLLQIDILWAKHILPLTLAGVYGLLNLVDSVLVTTTTNIARPAAAEITVQSVLRVLRWTLPLLVGVCLLEVAGYFLIGARILPFVSPNIPALPVVPLLLLFVAMIGYSVLRFAYICLAVLHKSIHVVLMTCIGLLECIGLSVFGTSVLTIALIHMTLLCTGAVAGLLLLRRSVRVPLHQQTRSATMSAPGYAHAHHRP